MMNHRSEYIGKTALVRYKGGVTGEEAIDDHSTGDPESVSLGVGELPRGIDEAFLDMEIGEQRTVVIPCEFGYGEHDPKGVQAYPRALIRNGTALQKGDAFAWENPVSGKPIPIRVIEASDQVVTIDFNHPFAGKELTYWLELVDIK